MSQPTKEQMIAALEKSGYLFEQDVATILGNLEYHVETNFAYTDLDEGKSREIDVRAIKEVYRDDDKKVQVFIELLVECKDFGSPLVFIERPKNSRERDYSEPEEYVFPKSKYRLELGGSSYREVNPFQYFELKNEHYYFKEDNKATQFSKIYKKGNDWFANHEGIYDSLILPQAKLLEHRKKDVVKYCRGDYRKAVWLFFPLVVLRDHLFAYDLSGPNSDLKEKQRISFVRQLDSSSLKGYYLTDFVIYDYLSDYVCSDVAQFSNSVIQLLKTRPDDVLK